MKFIGLKQPCMTSGARGPESPRKIHARAMLRFYIERFSKLATIGPNRVMSTASRVWELGIIALHRQLRLRSTYSEGSTNLTAVFEGQGRN